MPTSAGELSPFLSHEDIETQEESSFDRPDSTWDIFSFFPDHNPKRDNNASPASSSTPANSAFQSATHSECAKPGDSLDAESVYLLNQFKSDIATWMDIFDYECTYQREVIRQALDSELLFKCVCALTAKQVSVVEPSGSIWGSVAARHYGEALNLLIQQLNRSGPQSDALTAIILLGSYELIAAQGREHRSHYEGALNLVKALGINAQSAGIDRASFWVYVRHEIFVALGNECPLSLSPNDWNVSWRDDESKEDVLGNQLMWLAGQAVDLTFAQGSLARRHDLLVAVQSWYDGRPAYFTGVKYGDPTEDGLSKVYFVVPATGEFTCFFFRSFCFEEGTRGSRTTLD